VKISPPPNRRFSAVFVALSVLGAVTVFGTTASAAGAAAQSTAMKFTGHAAPLVTILSHGNKLPSGFQPTDAFLACSGNTPLLPTGPCPLHPPRDSGSPFGPASLVPNSAASTFTGNAPTLGSNFLGITDLSQRVSTGSHFTPPDQGLCVGPAGPLEASGLNLGATPVDATVEFEMTNDGWAVFDASGNTLAAGSNANLFSDGNSTGDPECTYDSATGTYFFTEIGAPNNAYYTTNLAEMNSGGYAAYSLDSSMGGGYCFPDFPHQGSDNHGLYITVNEFCGSNQDYAGTTIFAISKDQLVAHDASPNAVSFALGVQYFTMRPANGPSGTEYLLASEQNAPTQSALDMAWVTHDSNLATGGPVTMHIRSIPSEAYSEPVAAQSTGDDSTCVFNFGPWCSVPEATLDPIDMRLEQVQNVNGQLFTSLSTSMTVGIDPTVVNGGAWFQVDTAKMKVVKQGYVGAAGTYLLDPSFVQSKGPDKFGRHRHFVMAFSMTSPTLNPSTGYVTSTNSGTTFSSIVTTGAGTGPHVSFSTFYPNYDRRRWGDYSAIAIDPATHNVWSADEFIPGGADGADQVDNWGTEVWQLSK